MSALTACADNQNRTPDSPVGHDSLTQNTSHNSTEQPISEKKQMSMWMTVDGHRFEVTFEDTATAYAFAAQLPLTLNMQDLHSNEKYAQLPNAVPTNASPANKSHARKYFLISYTAVIIKQKLYWEMV